MRSRIWCDVMATGASSRSCDFYYFENSCHSCHVIFLSSQGTEVNKNSTSYTSVVSPQKKKEKKKKKKKRKKRKIKKGSGARLLLQVHDPKWDPGFGVMWWPREQAADPVIFIISKTRVIACHVTSQKPLLQGSQTKWRTDCLKHSKHPNTESFSIWNSSPPGTSCCHLICAICF